MKPKTMLLMGAAIVCGLVASYMTSRLIAKNEEKVTVLAAKVKLPVYSPLKDTDAKFELREILKNEAPKDYVPPEQKDILKARTLKKPLDEGAIVTFQDLQDENKSSLESQLPPGKRAFAVATSAQLAAGGFVLPGSRVDVIHVSRAGNVKESESEYVLRNVLVRAVDLMPQRPDDRPGIVPTTVTLEVDPDEALKLASVLNNGTILLALCPFGGEQDAKDDKKFERKPEPKVVVEAPKVEPKVEPRVEAPPVKEEPKDETIKHVMTVVNGSGWVQAHYLKDKNGMIIDTNLKRSAENNDAARAPAVMNVAPSTPKATTPEEKKPVEGFN